MQETVYKDIKEELLSIASKGFVAYVVPENTKKDKRQFVKLHIRALNELIFRAEIDRRYINFFILLVNINCNYIEADTNLIRLSIKEIADNMGYSTVHTYNTLNILKKLDLIDFYKIGRNKYIIINPKYFAKFYNPRYMYAVEYAFENKKIDLQELIGKLTIVKELKKDKKNNGVEREVKQYVNYNFKN